MDIDIHQTAVAEFPDRKQAEESIRKLDHVGFNIRQLTLIGKGYFSQQHVMGYYGLLYVARCRGLRWAVNGGIWGLFFATSYLLLEGYTRLEIFPWLVLYLVARWALIFGMVGFLWGGFSAVKVRSRPALRYKTHFKASSYLLIATGDESQIGRFRDIMGLHLTKDVLQKSANETTEL